MSQTTLSLLYEATLQTLWMVTAAGLVTLLIGLPIGVLLYATRKNHLLAQPILWAMLSLFVNITRSIPFIILMMAVIPFTRLLVGTSIGTTAAIVPLSLCAIPFFARVTENVLLELPLGLVEAGLAMGASRLQIIYRILLPEALPGLLNGIVLTLVSLTGYSAMAGAIGGGGLGDLAYRYGYMRFDNRMMGMTVIAMVVLVQIIQWGGARLAHRFTHR